MISTIKHLYRTYQHTNRDKHLETERSPHWPTVEKHWLEKQPTCQACGGKEKLAVHHKVPWHKNKDLELDETNFITLCMAQDRHCHLLVAHGNNYKCWVDTVVELSAEVLNAYKQSDMKLVQSLIEKAREIRKGP